MSTPTPEPDAPTEYPSAWKPIWIKEREQRAAEQRLIDAARDAVADDA